MDFSGQKTADVDSLDIKILMELNKDARFSYRKIAEKLRVATGTVQSRIKRMEKSGVIKNYHARFDFVKLGYTLPTLIGVSIRRGENSSFIKKLEKNKCIYGLYFVTGEYDLIIAANFKNINELNEFINKELGDTLVEKSNTYLILKTLKEEHTFLS
ncbi:MAG: Lrp/AsnC family transcriptional regulator [Candidatus Micrarchaeota archaeon]